MKVASEEEKVTLTTVETSGRTTMTMQGLCQPRGGLMARTLEKTRSEQVRWANICQRQTTALQLYSSTPTEANNTGNNDVEFKITTRYGTQIGKYAHFCPSTTTLVEQPPTRKSPMMQYSTQLELFNIHGTTSPHGVVDYYARTEYQASCVEPPHCPRAERQLHLHHTGAEGGELLSDAEADVVSRIADNRLAALTPCLTPTYRSDLGLGAIANRFRFRR
ncbi:hypothetical protein J6590_047506 [Homalodisca vitripennis]|nr:hypothetical protein J6590_047506 [Homalodisca vitripennis]